MAFAGAVAVIATRHAITARWHGGPIAGWNYWRLLVTSPEVLVFLFFMITDPKTAPRNKSGQIVDGTSIAIVAALIISTQSGEFGTKVGILAALVILWLFMRAISRHYGTDREYLPTSTRSRAITLGGAVLVGATLLALGHTFTAEQSANTPLERHSEVSLDSIDLPDVTIADDLAHPRLRLIPRWSNRWPRQRSWT